jgi:hypothetical protein
MGQKIRRVTARLIFKNMRRRSLLGLLLCASFRGIGNARTLPVAGQERRGFVYEATRGQSRFFLAGSLHRLSADQHPPPWPYEYAFRQATRLVFEVDPDENRSVAASAALTREAVYTGRNSLDRNLPPEIWKRFSEYCAARGLNPKEFRRYKPWYAASWISDFEYERLGIRQKYGIDDYYHYRAELMRKPTSGLERPAQLIRASSDGENGEHNDNLADTLDSMAGLRSFFNRLAAAWAAGDEAGTLAVLCPPSERESGLWRRIVEERSRAWLPSIQKPGKPGELPIYFVGAGHLLGGTGLCAMLRREGYTVRQLESRAGL